jgi:hypothetical protein
MFWAWISKDEAEKEALMAAFEDIENSSDRAAAIVAAAFLEDHLAIALKRHFHQDEKILNETFRSSGPLGSFSAKINMAFLVGLMQQGSLEGTTYNQGHKKRICAQGSNQGFQFSARP